MTALELKDEQKTKIQAIQDKVQTDLQDLRKPDADGNRPNRATLQPKMKEINDQAKKDIEAVLTPEQLKKSESPPENGGDLQFRWHPARRRGGPETHF